MWLHRNTATAKAAVIRIFVHRAWLFLKILKKVVPKVALIDVCISWILLRLQVQEEALLVLVFWVFLDSIMLGSSFGTEYFVFQIGWFHVEVGLGERGCRKSLVCVSLENYRFTMPPSLCLGLELLDRSLLATSGQLGCPFGAFLCLLRLAFAFYWILCLWFLPV